MFDPRFPFKVTICDLEHSAVVNLKMYPFGNLLILRLTAWFTTFVATPYISATSRSIRTG